jgi:S1-C subfamily serine protease
LSIGGAVLVAAAVGLTLLVTSLMSRPKTDVGDNRASNDAQSSVSPSASPRPAIAETEAPTKTSVAAVSVPAAPASLALTTTSSTATPPTPRPSAVAPQTVAAASPTLSAGPATVPVSLPTVDRPLETVDLLRQINPMRDSARGAWTFQGMALASPRNEIGVLRLPVAPPSEYRLTLAIQRIATLQAIRTIVVQPSLPSRSRYSPRVRPPTVRQETAPSPELPQPGSESDESLDIVLSVGGHPAALVLDAWQRTTSGLELIDGKGIDQNGTIFHGQVFPQMRTAMVICTVTRSSVDATIDGRTIVHWTGQSDRLSIEPGLAAEVGNTLALVSSSQFRVERIELVSLDGNAPGVSVPTIVASSGSASSPSGQNPPASAVQGIAAAHATPSLVVATPKLPAVPSPEVMQCVALIEHPLGSGSGFAVGKKLVATNAHVVEGVFADEIKVRFGTEKSKSQPAVRILYFDRARDLAVLELQSGMPGLPVRGDYSFTSGDQVTLVGNPTAGGDILMRNAVNHGRFNGMVHIKGQDFYQIEASVNPGWSGGPVLDAEGKVVAIVAMKAADRVVAELRGSMTKLDQDFSARIGRTIYNVGLTYGIPASDLWNILKDPDFESEARQMEANDRCAAKTLTDRLSFLAELAMLRVQINVPGKVREEAMSMSRGTLPPGVKKRPPPGEVTSIMPEFEASRLARLLESDTVKSMESKFQDHLDDRLSATQASESLPDPVKRELRALSAKIHEANKFAEHPSNNYIAFSGKVKGFSRDFKEHLKRLAQNLKEKES